MASTASAASKTTFRFLTFSFRKKLCSIGKKNPFFFLSGWNKLRFSKIFFFCGDEKKHKNGERIRYRMKERTVFLLIIIVAAIRVDKVNKWYSSLPFWNCPSNFLIFCFVSYPRSSSLGLFLHSDFCEELIYIEDTIVLENRALFQAIVLSPPAQCVKCPFFVQKLQILEKLENGQFMYFLCQNWLF